MIITVPATSANLGPGFDCLGLAFDYRNTIEIVPSSFFSVSVKGEGARFLKTRGGNIFLNIFNEVHEKLTGDRGVYRFRFENRIPISRGLGSSSAVIVSAITAAYAMAGQPIDKGAILDRALIYESHPDNIAPATHGGFNVAVAKNGHVNCITTPMDTQLRAVVVIPDKPISTRASRNALPRKLPLAEAAQNVGRASLMVAAMMNRQYDLLRVASEDRYHQHVRMKLLPALFGVQKTALENGALMSTLSGSGSSFFSLAQDPQSAETIASAIKRRFGRFRVEIFEFDNDGVAVSE